MELDKRIKKGKRPLTCLDAEQAKLFIGKECYFSDFASKYEKIEDIEKSTNSVNYSKDVLTYVNAGGQECAFTDSKKNNFRYCLPVEWTEEKQAEFKWRAYTIAEFQETFTIGRAVRFRRKDAPTREHLLAFNGYYTLNDGSVAIVFGSMSFALERLFEQYEWQEFYTEDYRPFGVEE